MSPQLIEAHGHDLAYLIGLADADLAGIWAGFGGDFQATLAGLIAMLPDLVGTYGSAATALGADWYEEARADAGVSGRFAAIPAALPDVGRTNALAQWAMQLPTGSTGPSQFDPFAAEEKVKGGLQRIIANADRDTIIGSSVADPKARGWKRVGRGQCAFCSMLIARGAVYTESSARFASHDHCQCSAAPAWGGQPEPVNPYTSTDRHISDADRARVRAWMAANP